MSATTASPSNEGRRLAGQVAIVTGAARGIGLAIAERLAGAGAAVMLADRNRAGAREAADRLARSGARSASAAVDIRRADQVDELIAKTRSTFGGLDILVNNAAHAHYGFAADLAEEDWRDTLDVCLTGTFMCAQGAARAMIENERGKIINISSIAARVGLARTAAYAAAKGGIEALTRVLAVELAESGIQVNAIAPGPIDTEFSREVVSESGRAARIARLPGAVLGEVNDVAGAALFLASPDSNWVTGTTVVVDGGYTIAGAIESRNATLATVMA